MNLNDLRKRIDFIASLNIPSEFRDSLIREEIAKLDSESAPLSKMAKPRHEEPVNASDCPQVDKRPCYPFLTLADIVDRNELPKEALYLGKGVSAEYARRTGRKPIRQQGRGRVFYPADHEHLIVQIVEYMLRPQNVPLTRHLLQVLAAFADYRKDATVKEIADTRTAELCNITSQVTQLRRGGYLEIVGKRRAVATGKASNVYHVTHKGWTTLVKVVESGDMQ